MKKILIIAITAMFVSGTALAGDQGVGGNNGDSSPIANGQANNNSSTTYNGFSPAEVQDMIDQALSNRDNVTRDLNAPTTTNQNVHYSGEYKMKNTPNVSAPALTTTMTETCMGSTSAGGATAGFGLSFGTTWRDGACVRRLDARELNSLGYRLGAKELMCDSDNVREALKRAGTPCYNDLPVEAKRPEDRAVVAPVVAPAEESPALGYQSVSVLDMDY